MMTRLRAALRRPRLTHRKERDVMRTVFRAAGLAIAISLVLATAVLAKYIVGTSGPDLIGGTQTYDTIRSGPGSDRVWG
jgi:hypothetical protein